MNLFALVKVFFTQTHSHTHTKLKNTIARVHSAKTSLLLRLKFHARKKKTQKKSLMKLINNEKTSTKYLKKLKTCN